jgi:hypothetical protein
MSSRRHTAASLRCNFRLSGLVRYYLIGRKTEGKDEVVIHFILSHFQPHLVAVPQPIHLLDSTDQKILFWVCDSPITLQYEGNRITRPCAQITDIQSRPIIPKYVGTTCVLVVGEDISPNDTSCSEENIKRICDEVFWIVQN